MWSLVQLKNFNPRSLAGATVSDPQGVAKAVISIHAPSRERLLLPFPQIIILVFQSTLPRGSDEAKEKILKHRQISIHAPSRERRGLICAVSRRTLFQSTLPRGSDLKSRLTLPSVLVFQSTLPRGSDLVNMQKRGQDDVFQSTLPRGSDGVNSSVAVESNISIHAPSRERPATTRLMGG